MSRIESVMELMFISAMSLPGLKRRHLDQYAYAWNIAKAIGLALGVVDRAGLVPGVAPARLPI